MRCLLVYIVLLYGVVDVQAQDPGTCSPGVGEAQLDVGNVRARLLNNGNLFWQGSPAVYEVPKGSGNHAVFNAALWVGGLVNDSLRIAAARYGGYEFWPGPLSASGTPPADCADFDNLAPLYREDVERYEQFGDVSHRLRDWAWQWGAPVLDGDGDRSNYNLAGGDRPELLGDQTVWWVMNDMGNVHNSTDSQPLGLEVRASAFAFNTVGTVGNTTFYRYQLQYKGTSLLDSAYVALFLDTDLGDFGDDLVGSDTTLGMGYTYNGRNEDGDYGEAPPALGISFIRGPRAFPDSLDNDRDGIIDEHDERLRLTGFMYYNSSGNVQGDPTTGPEYYNYMRSRWKDGVRLTFGGDGRSFSDVPTAFAYPGDPVTRSYWSEFNADGRGNVNTSADRRFVVSMGPFRMEPGAVEDVVIAIVWSRGDSNLDSVRKLREDMAYIQAITSELLQPRAVAQKKGESFALGYHHNYPNPFSEQTTIRYSLEQREHVTLRIYDMLGREVTTLVDAWQDAGWHAAAWDAASMAPGAYMYRLHVGVAVATETMVVAR